MDNELFELCKRVYEATGWKYTIGRFHDDGSYDGYVGHKGVAYTPSPQVAEWLPKDIPLYTSDYLLEKLQQSLKHKNDQISVFNDSKGWSAKLNINFIDDDDIYHHRELNDSYGHNTPLKALLKLTIKLYEEGLA